MRLLSISESFKSLSFQFHINNRTIFYILKQVCGAFIKILRPVYLKTSSEAGEWFKVINEIAKKWNFPIGLGAIDGKHVVSSWKTLFRLYPTL